MSRFKEGDRVLVDGIVIRDSDDGDGFVSVKIANDIVVLLIKDDYVHSLGEENAEKPKEDICIGDVVRTDCGIGVVTCTDAKTGMNTVLLKELPELSPITGFDRQLIYRKSDFLEKTGQTIDISRLFDGIGE